MTAVLQIDAYGHSAPANIHLTPGLAWWCMGRVQALMFPGGWWNVLLRPRLDGDGTWDVEGVPVRGTRPFVLTESGHLPIAYGTDLDALCVAGMSWCSSASTLAMRVDAARWIGRGLPVSPCDIHGRGCDVLRGGDMSRVGDAGARQ